MTHKKLRELLVSDFERTIGDRRKKIRKGKFLQTGREYGQVSTIIVGRSAKDHHKRKPCSSRYSFWKLFTESLSLPWSCLRESHLQVYKHCWLPQLAKFCASQAEGYWLCPLNGFGIAIGLVRCTIRITTGMLHPRYMGIVRNKLKQRGALRFPNEPLEHQNYLEKCVIAVAIIGSSVPYNTMTLVLIKANERSSSLVSLELRSRGKRQLERDIGRPELCAEALFRLLSKKMTEVALEKNGTHNGEEYNSGSSGGGSLFASKFDGSGNTFM
ncbi:hypothetical protein ACFE04_005232 [Oxalis oulophora]